MTPTTTCKGFHKFIGLVNYYRNMWARYSHMLEPIVNPAGHRFSHVAALLSEALKVQYYRNVAYAQISAEMYSNSHPTLPCRHSNE